MDLPVRLADAADRELLTDIADRVRAALMQAIPIYGGGKPMSLIVSAMTIVQAELIAQAPAESRGAIIEHEQQLLMETVKMFGQARTS